MESLYQNCMLCPRRCGVNRLGGAGQNQKTGYCGESNKLRIACASIHRGEEPPITGRGGSGTIFISGCNLGCVFCQNYQISQAEVKKPIPNAAQNNAHVLNNIKSGKIQPMGRQVSSAEFAEICCALEKNGAENINIVTGSHAIPAIAEGIDAARTAGLHIPVLWNTSSYENTETLELLRGRVTGFLPDLKTLNCDLAARFFNAPDYPDAATAAISKMIELSCHSSPPAVDRIIIRHLILPGFLQSTQQVLRWFADNALGRASLSLMTQYTPPADSKRAAVSPRSYVSEAEYEKVLGWLEEYGIEDGFCQELVTGNGLSEWTEWLPDFGQENPFSSGLSKPVWHWQKGLLNDDAL